ncbi:hypothetical protein [Ilumatobacter nonamiensis]|uniref:hypothetical protein n=1 Tax=Ilumatobacter nonamiensis TaxID=467093 RepID=UPI00034D8B39|nr:hypothetical protein [Ilumatobacter nonamiensis]
MADSDPLSQMFNLLAAPIAGAVQSVEQFRTGVDQFQRGVENFNRTMENLNETSERINVLLAEVEEPLRAAVPQVTRTVKAADDMMKVVSGPAIAVAPGLQMLAETLNNPAMKQMPDQLAQMNAVLAEVTTRLAPLGQLADTAGGLFGGLKIPGFSGSSRPATQPTATTAAAPADPAPSEPEPEPAKKTPAKTSAAKRSARKSTAVRKKASAKKTPAKKKSATKKSS